MTPKLTDSGELKIIGYTYENDKKHIDNAAKVSGEGANGGLSQLRDKSQPQADYSGLRFHSDTATALQDATEAYRIGLVVDAKRCTMHAQRDKIMPADMQFARCIRGERQ